MDKVRQMGFIKRVCGLQANNFRPNVLLQRLTIEDLCGP